MLKKGKTRKIVQKIEKRSTSFEKGTFVHATIAFMKGLKYALHCINSPATHKYSLFVYFYQFDFF